LKKIIIIHLKYFKIIYERNIIWRCCVSCVEGYLLINEGFGLKSWQLSMVLMGAKLWVELVRRQAGGMTYGGLEGVGVSNGR